MSYEKPFPMKITHLLLSVALCLPALASAKQYYRFQNEQGQTVLLDQLTPEAIEKGYDVINDEGKLVQSVSPAKTIGEMQQEKKREQDEEKKKIEQQLQLKRDAELLRLFTSVDDIMRARDAALVGIDQRDSLNTNEQKLLIAALEDYQRQAADYERLGKPIPPQLKNSITEQQKQIAQRERNKTLIDEERQTISQRFEKDMVRFKELQSMRMAHRFKKDNGDTRKKARMLTCDTQKDCKDIWQLAQVYAQNTASGRLEVVTDTIILTSAPKKDTDIGLSFSKLPARTETQIILEVSCADSDAGEQLCNSSEARKVLDGFEEFIQKQLR